MAFFAPYLLLTGLPSEGMRHHELLDAWLGRADTDRTLQGVPGYQPAVPGPPLNGPTMLPVIQPP
jgi:hypothetical protein